MLAGNEGRAPCGAALLSIVVSKDRTFIGYAINIGRLITHLTHAIATDIPDSNIITPDDEDIRLVSSVRGGCQQQRTARWY
jgi:hypothetical protein